MPIEKPLGSITQGSLSKGLEVRLHADISVEEMRVGKFLVVHGTRSRFFCMLTDVALGTGSQRILSNPPDPTDSFLQEVLAGTGTYGTIELSPMLMITDDPSKRQIEAAIETTKSKTTKKAKGLASYQANTNADIELLPVKTIPSHFSQVYDASERDFRAVFGWEDDPLRRNFAIALAKELGFQSLIGNPIDCDLHGTDWGSIAIMFQSLIGNPIDCDD